MSYWITIITRFNWDTENREKGQNFYKPAVSNLRYVRNLKIFLRMHALRFSYPNIGQVKSFEISRVEMKSDKLASKWHGSKLGSKIFEGDQVRTDKSQNCRRVQGSQWQRSKFDPCNPTPNKWWFFLKVFNFRTSTLRPSSKLLFLSLMRACLNVLSIDFERTNFGLY